MFGDRASDRQAERQASGKWSLEKLIAVAVGVILLNFVFQWVKPSGNDNSCTSGNGYDRGIALDLYGDRTRAVAAYTEYLKDHPDNLEVLRNRGNDYDQLGQLDNAVADLSLVLRRRPDDTFTLMDRARVYQKQGRFDSAIADLTKAVQLLPGVWMTWQNRGDVYMAHGDYPAAVADYTRSLAAGEADKVDLAHFPRGMAYLREGQFDLARADFASYLASHVGAADATKGRDCAAAGSNSGNCALPYPTPPDPMLSHLVDLGARQFSGCE